METAVSIELGQVARDLGQPVEKVERTVGLLDEGNTVPFITRYRKDQTGGLDEEQIRQIQERVTRLRLLAERKSTVLKSIEAQGKLTGQLARKIKSAQSIKRLEDLYLPFKPKKQTLATIARQRGLEPLATQIFEGEVSTEELAQKATQFVRVDRDLFGVDEVMAGVGHLLAERFSERAELRGQLRRIIWRSGKLSSSAVSGKQEVKATDADKDPTDEVTASEPATDPRPAVNDAAPTKPPNDNPSNDDAVASHPDPDDSRSSLPATSIDPKMQSAGESVADIPADSQVAPPAEHDASEVVLPNAPPNAPPQGEPAPPAVTGTSRSGPPPVKQPVEKKASKKTKRKQKEENAFKDYFDFCEHLSRIPPHRILAINRGERAKSLRVKIVADTDAMQKLAEDLLIPAEHPHHEFLKTCANDALSRLVLPALEREVRRELTERAERHAVNVFARNLRKLLLQPPVRDRRVLAIDPGFRYGCKLAALDQFGNIQAHGVIHIVGNSERRQAGRQQLIDMIQTHELSVVAIGNGTGCRETEQLIADILATELKDHPVEYVMVNEAGASVYSTSTLGREELPEHDATIRSAVSIGRRLLDPLSELVKINAANIGVGLYQHDVKSSHLKDSLDDVVASCVNFVGVDINTASPALLRYVSGLNQLTARRIYEHRQEHGPFQNREQLRDVAGFGEATLIQSAGFLKITDGDNPLDATAIHPESYPSAIQVLERLDSSVEDLAGRRKREPAESADQTADSDTQVAPSSLSDQVAQVNVAELAGELNVGQLLLEDILANIVRPGRDPREDLPQPIFRREIIRLEDLKEGMELVGTVLNVVDFGAFVDIGLKDTGLVHISRLADRFVADPHEVVSVGDVMKVWVIEVDRQRRRVALTAIAPGTEGQTRGGGRRSQPRRGSPQRKKVGAKPVPRNGMSSGPASSRPAKSRKPQSARRPRRAKPVKPITKEMVDGKEPMRSFSDLKQFFDRQDEPPESEQKDDK